MQYPKGVREALCAAQSALWQRAQSGMDVGRVPGWVAEIQHMIDEIDQIRPLSSNGKHGELHTWGCGCDGHTQSWSIHFTPRVG